ncbi:hypothetical protein BpHYR1_010107 [Brachionus plicatilis]|uniref:RNA-directed DNA polymerase from mobile element jockey-like n=1 Tax=Brachionus plicatilis TaxID=10195 RepID=A0A3M7S7P9_BRAPC|nr:hypothetical protein BpHYR1_010107 [Brachionus plicatilis]
MEDENLFNKTIPYSKTNKFLGLYFDESLCFDKQIKELNHNTLASLYKALIGSILDYNFPCLNSFSESGLQKLQVIQYTAVRYILKLPLRTSSESLFYEAENKLNINLFQIIKEASILH